MCGRFGLFRPQVLAFRFGVSRQMPLLEAAYNITPESMHPVITGCRPSQVSLMKWGLIPYWAKDPKIGYSTINARAEGILDKPSFRKPIRSQRCLVPVDGFYEWQKTTVAGKRTKVPYFIHLKDAETFAFAGLYDVWRDADGRQIATFTIVTAEPNELMATIDNRMPVILPRESESIWLDPTPLRCRRYWPYCGRTSLLARKPIPYRILSTAHVTWGKSLLNLCRPPQGNVDARAASVRRRPRRLQHNRAMIRKEVRFS